MPQAIAMNTRIPSTPGTRWLVATDVRIFTAMTSSIDRLTAALNGRYGIARQLGEGGMATVCLVRDLKHDRQVALKVPERELGSAREGGT